MKQSTRRQFLKTTAAGAASFAIGSSLTGCTSLQSNTLRTAKKPNLVFVFADQWRVQATGYAGDPNAVTPNLDKLEKESVNLTNAVAGCPVCCPYRASLITGRYPLTHGVFLNDVRLNNDAVSIAQAYNNAGYQTAYIGKWHLNGYHRKGFVKREHRQGFKFFKALDCTHRYNDSDYFADDNVRLKWDGYDAIAQTREAQKYIQKSPKEKTFALFLSWGPPHNPYETAPKKYRDMFRAENIKLRPNVPKEHEKEAKKDLAGYYAHIAALDDCIGDILKTLKETGIEDNTIFVFTSDHGDMLYSHGWQRKQKPWDESIKVPFLLRYPAVFGKKGKEIDVPFDAPDIMPTLLGLSGIKIPRTVEGEDFSSVLMGTEKSNRQAALISCPAPFGEWTRKKGGREYRGVRTRRYTYARTLKGPWLLYDNKKDPYQHENLCNKPKYAKLQKKMEFILAKKLKETNDDFRSGWDYIKKWNYEVHENGTAPFSN